MLDIKFGGLAVDTWREGAERVLGAFFGPTPIEAANDDLPDLIGAQTRETQGIDAEIVGRAMSKVKKKKAPGLDGLSGDVVREAFKVIPSYFQSVYHKCFSTGRLPRAWKKSEVVIFLKADDKPITSSKSYRPICLLPALSKVLEGMIDRLKEDRQGSRISQAQFGFVEGKSTTDAWLQLRRLVTGTVEKYVLGIFIDFSGAFDNLRWDAVIDTLRALSVRDLGLWMNYFSGRSVGTVGRVLRNERRVNKKILDVWWGGVFSATALYGCTVWMNDMIKVASVSALDRCERAALYGCLPFCRTVSTAAMEIIGGYLPWRFQAIELGLLYKLKRGIPTDGQLPCQIPDGASWTQVKMILHECFLSRWNEEWSTAEVGKVTRLFLPTVFHRQRLTWLFPNMHELFLLTGHGSLNKYLYRIGQAQSPLCRCGNGEEDVFHVLFQCGLYDDFRPWDPGTALNNVPALLDRDRYVEFVNFARAAFRSRTEALEVE